MELTHENNAQTAADPQAIVMPPAPKQPLSNNDPTRNVSSRQGIESMLLVVVATLALFALMFATIRVMIRP